MLFFLPQILNLTISGTSVTGDQLLWPEISSITAELSSLTIRITSAKESGVCLKTEF